MWTVADFKDLFDYNHWANQRVLRSLQDVSEADWTAELGGSFGSLQATTAHLVGAEWIWLQRWQGRSPSSPPGWLHSPSVERLQQELEALEEERRQWLAALSDSDLQAVCSYRFVSGASHQTRLEVLLRHLVNHSSYHRGQIATLLRQAGMAPQSTDLLVWDLERNEMVGLGKS